MWKLYTHSLRYVNMTVIVSITYIGILISLDLLSYFKIGIGYMYKTLLMLQYIAICFIFVIHIIVIRVNRYFFNLNLQSSHSRCSVKKFSEKVSKNHSKTPAKKYSFY